MQVFDCFFPDHFVNEWWTIGPVPRGPSQNHRRTGEGAAQEADGGARKIQVKGGQGYLFPNRELMEKGKKRVK